VAECLSGDPSLRPSARSIVLALLGGTLPADRALPEGARRADMAARVSTQPAPDLAPLGAGRADGPPGGHAASGSPAGGHGGHSGGRTGRAGSGHAGPDQAARRRPSGNEPRRRSGGPGIPMIVAGVLVIAVVAFVIVRVLGSAGSDQAQESTTSPTASTRSASPRAKPSSPAAAITVPPTFAGAWSGQARQVNPPDEFQVKLSLSPGVGSGSVAYSNTSFHCVGQLSPDSVASDTMTLDQGITSGRHTCADGTVTLTTGPDGTLKFAFRGKTGPVASGTLTKS
jgi:hypothetical protein